jgi:hypothetical protein
MARQAHKQAGRYMDRLTDRQEDTQTDRWQNKKGCHTQTDAKIDKLMERYRV